MPKGKIGAFFAESIQVRSGFHDYSEMFVIMIKVIK